MGMGLLCQEGHAADEELPDSGGGTVRRALSPGSVFLTKAHVVSKRLLVVKEL